MRGVREGLTRRRRTPGWGEGEAAESSEETRVLRCPVVSSPRIVPRAGFGRVFLVGTCTVALAGCRFATPTATPVPTITPTTTPSATSTPTATPTATPTPTFPADAFVEPPSLNIRGGPNTLHPVVGAVGQGTAVAVEGKNDDGGWLAVRSPAETRGWINADFVRLVKPLDAVPTQPTPTSPPTLTPTPEPMDPTQPFVVSPAAIAQGDPVLVRVRAEGAGKVLAVLADVETELIRIDGATFAGLLAAPPDLSPGQQSVFLTIIDGAGGSSPQSVLLPIRNADYASETITLDTTGKPNLAVTIDPVVRAEELERMRPIWQTVSPERLWQGAWRTPMTTTMLSSPFGTRRNYNDGVYNGFHNGVDFRARPGTPVYAPARGRVAVAETQRVTGNTVWIDHGWGVYSGFAHLERWLVDVGRVVEAGDVIGAVGGTGAATGPHLHWEVRVHGVATAPLGWTLRDVGAVP